MASKALMAEPLVGGPVRLVDSPIRYMQARIASGPPRLYSAIVPVVLNALFAGGAGFIMFLRPVLESGLSLPATGSGFMFLVILFIISAIVFGLVVFAIHVAAVIVFDLLTVQSRQGRRLAELCALAYWPQLLCSIPVLAAMWLFYDPPPMVLQGEGADAMQADMRYAEQLFREPVFILTTQVQWFADLWLVGLHACTLRVVSGLTVGGTSAAGVILAVLFLGVPWLAGQAAERWFF